MTAPIAAMFPQKFFRTVLNDGVFLHQTQGVVFINVNGGFFFTDKIIPAYHFPQNLSTRRLNDFKAPVDLAKTDRVQGYTLSRRRQCKTIAVLGPFHFGGAVVCAVN